jgi:YHS domain-containing protein
MKPTYLATALAGALALGLTTAAMAATGEFDNMCAQGLAMHKQVKTDCSVNGVYQGKTYCFGNEQAKQSFMKDPAANLAKAQEFYKSEHKG